jgi:hypothetical protein
MMKFKSVEDDYDNLELVPPPLFTRQEMPFDYRYISKHGCVKYELKGIHNFLSQSYQQNPAVVKVKVRQPDGSVCITRHWRFALADRLEVFADMKSHRWL